MRTERRPFQTMLSELTLTSILIVAYLLYRWYRHARPHRFPPGPTGVPFFGNLVAFRKSPLVSMMRWKERYGDVVGLNLGQYRAVLLSDYTILKDAFNNEDFNGRPEFKPALLFTGGKAQGTLTSDGHAWGTIRRFTIKNLSKLGFGRKSTECMIQDDIEEMIQNLCSRDLTQPIINLHSQLYVPVANHLWYILVGKKIPEEQYESFRTALIRLHTALWQPIGSAIWFMPWLTNLFPVWTGWKRLVETLALVKNLINNEIDKHKMVVELFKNGDSPRDLIEAYLQAVANTTDPISNFFQSTGENHMRSMVLNLFVTGAEAVSNTLNWTFIYLSLYPEVQQNLFDEIEQVIGSSRSPSLSDVSNMPYASAVIQEVLRMASTSPFSNFQFTTTDVEFHGYLIPKNTVVIGNLYSIHHSVDAWGDPEVFRPERFIGPNRSQAPLIPFSVGLRVCLGQSFAKNELFLFMVTLCQRFKFSLDPTTPLPTPGDLIKESHVSIFRFAKAYNFVLLDRWYDYAKQGCVGDETACRC